MSKATRLQKSGLTKELISEQPPLQVEKPELKPWKKLTNKKTTGRTILRQLLACLGAFGEKKKRSWQGQCIYVKMCGYLRLYTCARACVFVACVCERACARLLHCVHSCFVGRGASFFMTFSIWPPEESYYNRASLVLLGTIRT